MISTRRIVESVRTGVEQYTDMRLRWRAQTDEGASDPSGEVFLDVGGRWDGLAKRWDGRGQKVRTLELQPAQFDAARLLAAWMKAKARGERLLERGKPIYSVLLNGGRRGGKTDLAAKVGVTFAVMKPRSFVWLVSETEKKTGELAEVVKDLLPRGWYEDLGAPHFTFTLRNGSVIWLRSAHDPEKLRTGRCDFAVLNEAQLMSEAVFAIVRGATTDNGGLTVLTANPPHHPIGFWIERFRNDALAGKRQAREFFIDTRKNPHVDHESLEAMKDELDERTYKRDVLGMFLPRLDVVFHAWSDGPHGNLRALPEVGKDITQEFLRKHLRREFDAVLGVDLQRNPYPCAIGVRFYEDPENPGGDPLVWFDDEVIVEGGDEEALSLAMIEKGYDPKRTALIVDASGSWQRIDRQARKVPAFDLFRQLGWPYCYKPDTVEERNPPILERMKNANHLFMDARGKRRVFCDPSLTELAQALKLYENKNGTPYRKSIYAHLADAATYPLWRFFPRKAKPPPAGAKPRGQTFAAHRPGYGSRY